LTELTVLHLDFNQISSIPPEIGNLSKLNTLGLADNLITSVPDEISNLTNLADFYLYQNQLTFEDIIPIIDLPDNYFQYYPQDSIGIKSDINGYTGQEISFTVGGGGNTWQWFKDGVPLSDGGYISGATTATLSVANPESSDEGAYHCEVTHTSAWQLTLYSRPTTLSVSSPIESVTDIDGNVYNTVTIGDQTWMAENLKTTTYNDGTPIPNVTDNTEWSNLSSGAYCWYNNNETTYKDSYGALYNWYTVETENLCPSGWHVPDYSEWTILIDYLGGNSIAGGKLKEAGTEHWLSPNTDGTNESGFTARPAGARVPNPDDFVYLGEAGFWWTSLGTTSYYNPQIYNNGSEIFAYAGVDRGSGLSIRCLKNSEAVSSFSLIAQNAGVDEGQPVEIPISVTELTASDNIISYQFDIDYDNTSLEYTGTDLSGTLAEGGTVTVNSSVAGKLKVSYMNSTALVGSGDILNLQFNTLKADTTDVFISNAYLNATEVTELTTGTAIIRDVTSPSAEITYDDTENRCGDNLLIIATFDEPILETNPVNLSLSGATTLSVAEMTRVSDLVYTFSFPVPRANGDVTVTLSGGTDLWGNEVVTTPNSGNSFTITGITLGDVDDDGKILAYDAALTLQHSVGLDPLPDIDPLPWENWRDTTANVDGVGVVTANDAGMILQYSAGIITSFDASVKKSLSQAFISLEVVNNEIILYSYGDLLGLNIAVDNADQILGTPEILDKNFLSATNIDGSTYNIGLCNSVSPESGSEILKIPYTKSGSIELNMTINTETETRNLNLSFITGIEEEMNDGIILYPNPVSEILNIQGVQNITTAHIFSTIGQLMFSREIGAENDEINVAGLPSGLYILNMIVDGQMVVKQFAKE